MRKPETIYASPEPELVRKVRTDAGLTQERCAELLRIQWRALQRYEAQEGAKTERMMPPGLFVLLRIQIERIAAGLEPY